MKRKYKKIILIAGAMLLFPALAYAVASTLIVNGNATIGSGYINYGAPTNGLLVQGDVVIGASVSSGAKLHVAGVVESTSGGFKFPDGTTQTTAAATPEPISVLFTASNTASISISNLDLNTDKVYEFLIIGDFNEAAGMGMEINGETGAGPSSKYGWGVSWNASSWSSNHSSSNGYWGIGLGPLSTTTRTQHMIQVRISKPQTGEITQGSWSGSMTDSTKDGSAIYLIGGGNFDSTDNVTQVRFISGKNVSGDPVEVNGNWRVYLTTPNI